MRKKACQVPGLGLLEALFPLTLFRAFKSLRMAGSLRRSLVGRGHFRIKIVSIVC